MRRINPNPEGDYSIPWNNLLPDSKAENREIYALRVLPLRRPADDKPDTICSTRSPSHTPKNEIDHLGRYAEMPWTEEQKTYAVMVSRLDSDNRSSFAPESPPRKLFNQSANGLRGYKRSLYEGALRQAAFAWWPGSVPAGRVAEEAWAFWSFLPTVAELAGIEATRMPQTDRRSLLPFLKGGKCTQARTLLLGAP